MKLSLVRISGRSMYPLLKEGNRVLISRDVSRITRGDILVFGKPGHLVVHRVVKIRLNGSKKLFQTKGDASLRFDPILTEQQLVGRVVAVLREDRLINLETSLWQEIGVFISWVSLVIGFVARPIVRMIERKKRKRIRAEDLILLYCARTSLNEVLREKIRGMLSEDLDWSYLMRRGLGQSVFPLLFYNLKKIDDGFIPKSVKEKMERRYYANLHHNLYLREELNRILTAFENVEIDVIVLKGIALIENVYGNPALRPMGDIDLLIKEEDFGNVRTVIARLGYVPVCPVPHLSARKAVEFAHYRKQMRFSKNGKTLLEVHFRLLNMGVPAPYESAWEEVVPIKVARANAFILSPADFLLSLCIHANQHNYSRLLLLSDISEFLRTYGNEIDWRRFVDQIDKRRMAASVYHSLEFTQTLFGNTSIPQAVLRDLRPGHLKGRLFEVIWNRKKILSLRSQKRRIELEAPFYYLFEVDGLREKLLYFTKILPRMLGKD